MDNGIPESIDYKAFEFVKTLGKGTHGTVILAQQKNSKKKYAIKSIKKQSFDNEKQLSLIKREVEIMASLSHPHIITVHDVCESSSRVTMTLEYASGGELFDYVNESPGGLGEAESKRIFNQISSAVHYLHKKGIVHRDLKLENILLDFNKDAKIADFGLANSFSRDKLLFTYCGSPLYASPEIVKAEPYFGPEVDCWSLGVILYAMSFGILPFDGADVPRLKRCIVNGKYDLPRDVSPSLRNLIVRMLEPATEHRMIMKEVICHPWLNEPVGPSWPYTDHHLQHQKSSHSFLPPPPLSMGHTPHLCTNFPNSLSDLMSPNSCPPKFLCLDGNQNGQTPWLHQGCSAFYDEDGNVQGHSLGASNRNSKHHHQDFPSSPFLPPGSNGPADLTEAFSLEDHWAGWEDNNDDEDGTRPIICEVDFRTSSSDRLHPVDRGAHHVTSAPLERAKSENLCFLTPRPECSSSMFSSCYEGGAIFKEVSVFEDSLNSEVGVWKADAQTMGLAHARKFLADQLDSLDSNEVRIVQLQENDDNFSVDSLD